MLLQLPMYIYFASFVFKMDLSLLSPPKFVEHPAAESDVKF